MATFCNMLKSNIVFIEACMCSIGANSMDLDFLAALEASKITKAEEDFKRVLDANMEDAGAVCMLRSNRSATASCT